MSPTQPSEQRECKGCNYEKEYNQKWPHHTCNVHSEPSPEQDWMKDFDSRFGRLLTNKDENSFIFIEEEVKDFITAEKAKSYEAGQRDKVVEIRQQLEETTKIISDYYEQEQGEVRTELLNLVHDLLLRDSLHLPTDKNKK